VPIEKEITEDLQKKIKDYIVDTWKDWKKARQEKEEDWDECIKHYLCYVDLSKFDGWEWRSKVSRPISQEIGDANKAQIKAALFPDNEEFFDVEGLDDIGQRFKHLVKERMKDVLFAMRFTSRFDPFLMQLCTIGNSHAQLPWTVEVAYRKTWQTGQVRRKPTITWDGPKFETNDMFNVVFDPRETEYNQHSPRIIRRIVSKNYLKLNADLYELDDDLLKEKPPLEESDHMRDERRRIFGWGDQQIERKDDVELLIYTGDMFIDDQAFIDKIFIVANRQKLIRGEEVVEFCGPPYIYANYTKIPNEMLGRGPLEPVRGLQRLIDTFTNQKADIINLILGGFFVYSEELLDPENLIMRPYGMVSASGDVTKAVASLAPTAQPTLAFSEIADLKQECEQSSIASKNRQGQFHTGRRTATEAIQANTGGATRFNDIIINIGEMAIEPALNMILAMDFQMNYGNEYLLPRPAWEGSYRIHFYGARASAMREVELQLFAQFTDIVTRNPMFVEFVNPPEFVKEWQKLLRVKNPNLIRQRPLSQQFPGIGGNKNGEGGSLPATKGSNLPMAGAGSRGIR
jgi:hypothetical protein